MTAHFLAFDLGAESGRTMLGRLCSGVLTLTEVSRFANEPVRYNGALQWDILRLWLEMQRSLERVPDTTLESIGIDTWGCDYALVGEQGALLGNPYHYRDSRTDGIMDAVFERVSRAAIYETTGIQFLAINTLFQLYAACQKTPQLVDAARAFGTIPDILNYWLTGKLTSEFTNATTTQLVDARTRSWAIELLESLEIPTRLFMPIVEPGTEIGRVRPEILRTFADTPVIAPACHDTASAVAAVSCGGRRAFLSSGTWSLLGTELPAPIITTRARDLNFTNEGGVCGTTRLLKNISGMWLLQACRRTWADRDQRFGYDELLTAAAEEPPFRALVDPDHRAFLHPSNMVTAIAEYCAQTGQPVPEGPPGFSRTILESLAFKYRHVLESLEELTGTTFDEIRIVGGGSRNRLLNQLTADATGKTVVAGPVEATALGNIAMQMLATGAVSSLDAARGIIERSFPVERFEPSDGDQWNRHYGRFREYVDAGVLRF